MMDHDRNEAASAQKERASANKGETRDLAAHEKRTSLAAGDDSVDAAIGAGAGVSGTGESAARSGQLSGEGNRSGTVAPDPGDPGGMGGVRSGSGNAEHRPPGGMSPIDDDEESSG